MTELIVKSNKKRARRKSRRALFYFSYQITYEPVIS
jgi:hypothetical protein